MYKKPESPASFSRGKSQEHNQTYLTKPFLSLAIELIYLYKRKPVQALIEEAAGTSSEAGTALRSGYQATRIKS
jgi:hypothetical protein